MGQIRVGEWNRTQPRAEGTCRADRQWWRFDPVNVVALLALSGPFGVSSLILLLINAHGRMTL